MRISNICGCRWILHGIFGSKQYIYIYVYTLYIYVCAKVIWNQFLVLPFQFGIQHNACMHVGVLHACMLHACMLTMKKSHAKRTYIHRCIHKRACTYIHHTHIHAYIHRKIHTYVHTLQRHIRTYITYIHAFMNITHVSVRMRVPAAESESQLIMSSLSICIGSKCASGRCES